MEMRSIQRQGLAGASRRPWGIQHYLLSILLMVGKHRSLAFQSLQPAQGRRSEQRYQDRQSITQQTAVIDPSDIPIVLTTITSAASAATSEHHHASLLVQHSLSSSSEAIVLSTSLPSTLISSTVEAIKAHGHSNPLFGPPNPNLQQVPCHGGFWQFRGVQMCPQSIAPTANALKQLSLEYPELVDSSSSMQQSVKDLLPNAPPALQDQLQQLILKKGDRMLVPHPLPEQVMKHPTMPGFVETRSLLAPHDEMGMANGGSPELNWKRFAAGEMYADTLMRVFNKLPYVAFGYAAVEFFVLRPNSKDLYKKDVEDDPLGVTTETLSDVGVRVGIFFVLAMLTLVVA